MSEFRILGAPSRYIQGPGAIEELAKVVEQFGSAPLLIADPLVMDLFGRKMLDNLYDAGQSAMHEVFSGECTSTGIDQLTARARNAGCDVVIGVGGGKAIDTAKGVRHRLGLPVVIVPTIASNDAPTSRLIVIYTEDHAIDEVRIMNSNPDVVLVDTTVICAAPSRFLVAGIGDALSKKFEAAQCAASGGLNFFGGRTTRTALSLADSCYAILRADAQKALLAVNENRVDEHLERVVEASILMSGISFESGGLSLAHALTRGFTACVQSAGALHGAMVAFGLLVQLFVEQREPGYIDDLFGFYQEIGLPSSLGSLGIDEDKAGAVSLIAERTLRDAPYVRNLTVPINQEILSGAIWAADRAGTSQ